MESSPPYSRRADFGARVLVVDDDAIVRRSLQAMLERGHYKVETVQDGVEALRILPSFMPELVLLDILMPGMDGLETCRQIRALPSGDLLPIIFLTADDRPETHVNAFQAKGESHLPTALASMASKYLRELAMQAFNGFWSEHVPDLRPTAGYPVDALRFKADIAAAQQALGISDRILWRSR